MAQASRDQWSSSFGFFAAAVGSAVGLGNMWRFSYLTAEKGGAAFVALYLVFTLLIGLPVMLAELTVGRGARMSPVGALGHFGGRRWKALGALFVATGFLILSYYSVIAGWTVRYALEALIVGMPADPAAHFSSISEGDHAFLFHVLFMGVTMAIVVGGISRGIERVSVIAMPLLFFLVCGIALYAATLENSGGGYSYYLNADFQKALSMDVVVSAAGQAFFSLSLGMGAMMTFASYLPREGNLPRESVMIASADFGVAFLAGLMVFPIIFALGLQSAVGESTLGALFVALPQAFAEMGATGRVVGLLFFVALVVGALTSALSLFEVVVSAVIDGAGWTRRKAVLIMGVLVTLIGSAAAWNIAVLGVMDQVANNLFLLVGGLALAIFTGWIMKDPIAEARSGGGSGAVLELWRFLLRWVVPAALLFVLWHSVPATLASVWGLFEG
ncbi:MAG: sodium-dependent transporter [Myxococcota bacterium]|nr:sodium-dependent transporter [Myxococcota bacterium]